MEQSFNARVLQFEVAFICLCEITIVPIYACVDVESCNDDGERSHRVTTFESLDTPEICHACGGISLN